MLVAQNSLGPVCPVPLTVRGTSDVYRWRPVLQAQFNITTGDLKATNKGLTLNEAAIARAQMRSNCHDGWSCKAVALEKLRDIMSRGARRLLARSHAGHCRHWMLTDTVRIM